MTLVDLFRAGLEAGPHRTALIAGDVRLTFEQLDGQARALAGRLRRHPAGPPRRVGVLAGPSPTAFVGLLAAMYAGAAAVPLNPAFPARRTAAMIEAAGVRVVIADDRHAALAGGCDVEPVPPEGADAIASPAPTAPEAEAYVMFTSGSTGRPKGVPIGHANARHFFDWAAARYPLTPDDVVAQTFDPTFDLFLFAMFTAWPAGAAVCCVPPQRLGRLPALIDRHRISVWFSVPSTIRVLHRMGLLGEGRLDGIGTSLFCGEALTDEAARLWRRAAPNGPLDNLYGPTELTIACTAHRFGEAAATPNGVVPIGVPFPGIEHRLLPATGDDGELCITGPQMFRGYLDPADDEGRFTFAEGRRWYRTGDLVRQLPDGTLAYLGRLDSTIKVRGYRVELLEIEHALRAQPEVDECAVVAVERDGETALAAQYTGTPVPAATLMKALAETLPDYMVPRRLDRVDALPLNANGKIDRGAVRARAELEPRQA